MKIVEEQLLETSEKSATDLNIKQLRISTVVHQGFLQAPYQGSSMFENSDKLK